MKGEATGEAEAIEGGRGRWSTAFGLTLAVLVLSVFDALALVVVPLAMLMVALPGERRAPWFVAGAMLWVLALLLAGGTLGMVSRGWALMLGAIFLSVTLARPGWDVTSRGLTSVAIGVGIGAVIVLASGHAAELDATIRAHFTTVSSLALSDLQARLPDSGWVQELRARTERLAELQADLFPALLALQSVAALALAAWWLRRLGRSHSDSFSLARLRDFRFNDQLIWIPIAALCMVLLPLGSGSVRIALNALVFMAALYALRGLAIFVFLATGSRSIATMVLGALALVFLYPVALTAALLMGVGDTWLDVRRRVAAANPT